MIYGDLQGVSSYTLDGGICAIGTTGNFVWTAAPATDLFMLIVGTDPSSIYESSWGQDSNGDERSGTKSSFTCGSTTKVISPTCP